MTNTAETQDNKMASVTELGIEYSASFVPFSQSRNAKEKKPSINWKVTVKKGNQSLTTDYMQGIGHLPNYSHNFSSIVVYDDAVRKACETGKSVIIKHKNAYDAAQAGRIAPPAMIIQKPNLIDVLYSLVMDSYVLECGTFEEWASEHGYETDSRKAEKIYHDCLQIALKMRAMLGDAAMANLRVLFQDY